MPQPFAARHRSGNFGGGERIWGLQAEGEVSGFTT
jgi:hypothetical protein